MLEFERTWQEVEDEAREREDILIGGPMHWATRHNTTTVLKTALYRDWATTESAPRCPVCFDEYEWLDPVMKLPDCGHWLHTKCLEQWLRSANTCPLCRQHVTRNALLPLLALRVLVSIVQETSINLALQDELEEGGPLLVFRALILIVQATGIMMNLGLQDADPRIVLPSMTSSIEQTTILMNTVLQDADPRLVLLAPISVIK
ncbi:Ring u-box domain-containing protein [Mycena sanguinolenta]|uniref:Ring u-box domain-containing protein n=1 Tax=Mycena sanguinolenta TaxID=230812 RepID=A0A8H6ZA56_9AGAR|nr:Ring u-box domain-containing protein [Mycena sanguinolenta]